MNVATRARTRHPDSPDCEHAPPDCRRHHRRGRTRPATVDPRAQAATQEGVVRPVACLRGIEDALGKEEEYGCADFAGHAPGFPVRPGASDLLSPHPQAVDPLFAAQPWLSQIEIWFSILARKL